jgi:hypothetical protein
MAGKMAEKAHVLHLLIVIQRIHGRIVRVRSVATQEAMNITMIGTALWPAASAPVW